MSKWSCDNSNILDTNQPPSNGIGNRKEHQSKVWKIDALNQQALKSVVNSNKYQHELSAIIHYQRRDKNKLALFA